MKITYTTTDGKTFTDKKQAEAHEASLSDPKTLAERIVELEKKVAVLELANSGLSSQNIFQKRDIPNIFPKTWYKDMTDAFAVFATNK